MSPDCLDPDHIELARDMSWLAAMADHSQGLAVFYVVAEEETGKLMYGLVRQRNRSMED